MTTNLRCAHTQVDSYLCTPDRGEIRPRQVTIGQAVSPRWPSSCVYVYGCGENKHRLGVWGVAATLLRVTGVFVVAVTVQVVCMLSLT